MELHTDNISEVFLTINGIQVPATNKINMQVSTKGIGQALQPFRSFLNVFQSFSEDHLRAQADFGLEEFATGEYSLLHSQFYAYILSTLHRLRSYVFRLSKLRKEELLLFGARGDQ